MIEKHMTPEAALKKAGVKFEQPEKRDYRALMGRSAFTHYVRDASLFDASGLHASAIETPMVLKQPVRYQAPKGEWVESGRDAALVNEKTGEHYATVSKGYQVVQNRELLLEASEAIAERGLAVVGSVRQERGRFTASFVVADPDFQITLLKAHDRPIMSGFSLSNSYLGDQKVRAEASAIDLVCSNYNLWGKEVASFEATHLSKGDLTAECRKVLDETLAKAPQTRAMLEAAHEIEIHPKEVAPLAASVGFPEVAVDYVENFREVLEPATKERLTLLTLNQAATAYVTHVANTNATSLRALSEKATDLLHQADVEAAVERGRARIERWEERREKRERKKAEIAAE